MNQPNPVRRKIKELEVMVAEVIPETPDTTTLILFTGNDRLDYKAGHFLTIDPHQFGGLERFIAFFEDIKGKKEPSRAYSLASAPHEKYLAITIKEERYVSGISKYPPLLSPLLVKRMARGMRIIVTGFTGPYTLPDDIESRTDHIVHLCAGSGSVPNFSILKHTLVEHPKVKHTIVYSNKTWGDIIFRDALAQLERSNTERVKVIYSLTREKPTPAMHPCIKEGRITTALLREIIPNPDSCLVYACGPAISPLDRKNEAETGIPVKPRFLETVLESLAELGIPDERIMTESYG
ncbi:MAG: oxidoreductase [Bacteroidota bacterium]